MGSSVGQNVLWWLCLCVAPLILCVIELFHPQGFTHDPGMYAYLSHAEPHEPSHHALYYAGPAWWFTLHMIQTPLVVLVAIGLWIMVAGPVSSPVAAVSAWIARVATFVFAVYYTVLDAIGGIGLGRLIQITESLAKADPSDPHLTEEQLEGVILVLNTSWTDPWTGGVGSFVSLTGSWAVFLAGLAVAVTLWLNGRATLGPIVLLVAFGWILQISHASYTGPIAFLLLAIAALWIRIGRGAGNRHGPAPA